MFNLRLAADYLLHRLRANTRHGTHSPFVYRLVDEVIYDFRAKKVYADIENNKADNYNKTGRLLYRLVADWQPVQIVQYGANHHALNKYLQYGNTKAAFLSINNADHLAVVTQDIKQLDVVFITEGQALLQCFEQCLPNVYERTLMIVENIYCNKSTKQAWAKIKADPRVTVTIDLFFVGLVYFRKGQVKENFKIRF